MMIRCKILKITNDAGLEALMYRAMVNYGYGYTHLARAEYDEDENTGYAILTDEPCNLSTREDLMPFWEYMDGLYNKDVFSISGDRLVEIVSLEYVGI